MALTVLVSHVQIITALMALDSRIPVTTNLGLRVLSPDIIRLARLMVPRLRKMQLSARVSAFAGLALCRH